MSRQTKIYIQSLESLEKFAQWLAPQLVAGDVILLNGTLGAGKTTFIQFLGLALGIEEKVVSPTYVLIHDYLTGRIPLVHVDLYRLGPEQSLSLADELLSLIDEKKAILVVEWAKYANYLDADVTLSLELSVVSDETRVIEVEAHRLELLHGFERSPIF